MDAKIIAKYKGKTLAQLKNTAVTHFHKYIRLRDSKPSTFDPETRVGSCISSGRKLFVPSQNAQAGHFYSAGKYPALRFNEDNVHLQSKSDNYFMSGNLLPYLRNLEAKIGRERVDELDRIARETKGKIYKWDRFFLIEIIEKYKAKNREILKRHGDTGV